MPRLYLTDFIDIVAKSGTPKATKVKELKQRGKYDPRTDFYKNLRDYIIRIHKKNQARSQLLLYDTTHIHSTKSKSYSQLIKGYHKWWGRKSLEWFEPPKTIYSHQSIDVIINPELGLKVDNIENIIKLYFKTDPLTRAKATIITCLMREALNTTIDNRCNLGVLDIRNSKFYTEPTKQSQQIAAVANAELSYIASLWPNL